MFFNRFYPKSNWSIKLFCLASSWSCMGAKKQSKVRGSEINFVKHKLLKSNNPNPRGFVLPIFFKVAVINPQGFFWFEQLLFNKVDFGSDFKATVQLQIEFKRKMLGRSATFRLNLLKNVLNSKTFFEFTTPNRHYLNVPFRQGDIVPFVPKQYGYLWKLIKS